MPTFTALDGTELAYRIVGEGEPLLVLPGGPMRASAYEAVWADSDTDDDRDAISPFFYGRWDTSR